MLNHLSLLNYQLSQLKKNNRKTTVIGHAIVSTNCCIADVLGSMPADLRSESDWELFQESLNYSDLVLIGRASYKKFSESKRNRLIPTNQINGYDMREDLCFFNPNDIPINEILLKYNPFPNKIAVAGGQGVYQLIFDQFSYTEFHLSVKENYVLKEGIQMIKGITELLQVNEYMQKYGMYQSETRRLDSDTIQVRYLQS